MAQVIQKYDPWSHLGQLFGQGVGQGASQMANRGVQRAMTNQALQSLDSTAKNPLDLAKNPLDLAKNLISATAGLDDQGRILQALYAPMLSQMNMRGEQNLDLIGDEEDVINKYFEKKGNTISRREPREELPTFLNRREEPKGNEKFFPTNVGPSEAPGNLPQTATAGQPRPIHTGDALLERAQGIQGKFAKAGLVKSLAEAYEIAKEENEQNKIYNDIVEKERQQRVAAQEKYGNLAEAELKRLYPGATSEQEAVFRKKGEQIAGLSQSEADTKRTLARDVNQFKNTISNIEKSLTAPRFQNKISRGILGKQSSLKQAMNDAKSQVQPLLNEGLYDTARNLLAKANFYPEEREGIIFGEPNKDIVQTIDSIEKPKKKIIEERGLPVGFHGDIPSGYQFEYTPKSKENVKNSIMNVFQNPENRDKINLLQLRKLYEDKGYDWRVFKDALNELVNNREIELNDDQSIQMGSYLNEPPLNNIEKILYKLNLRGR